MGYNTVFQLVNIKIKKESIPIVTRIMKTGKGRGISEFKYFFDLVDIDSDGFLHFVSPGNYYDPYRIKRTDGPIVGLCGKWYAGGDIALWLAQHCEKGGRVIEHSAEGDCMAWGWEFDGEGGFKQFQIDHVGKWK